MSALCAMSATAQDAPDGYTGLRAPINNNAPRYQGYAASEREQAQQPVTSGIRPYQASPEFPINPPVAGDGTAIQGNGVQQGYTPNSVDGAGINSTVAPTPEPEEVVLEPENTKKAILRFTDKIAARSTELEVVVPSQVSYQTLVIQVEKCQIAAQDQSPENSVLMEIFASEDAQGNPINDRIFGGWMFKNKASLTNLQHPFYDVALVKCISDPSTKPKPPEPKKAEKPLDATVPVGAVAQPQATPSTPNDEQKIPINTDVKPEAALAPVPATSPLTTPIYQDAGAVDAKSAEAVANRAVEAVTKELEQSTPVSSGTALPENYVPSNAPPATVRQPLNQDMRGAGQGETDYPSSD